jgi:GlpG protein
LLLSSAGLSLWVDFGENIEALRYLTVTDFVNEGNRLKYTSIDYNFESMQLWRFISPIFVHFNLTHIVFNSLWIWIVGSVIERQHRSIALLLIVLFSGIASNVAQFIVSGPIFGGLSGVVYAIIGYAWLWDKLRSDKLSVVSNALMMFMIFWLVLGYSGLLSQLGFGNMANTAHLVGLISGLLCVPSIILIKKISSA